MAGVWDNTRRADVTNPAIPGFVKELPYTAWGRTKWEGYDAFMQTNGDYVGNCLPFGMSRSIYGPHPVQIIQDNDHLVMLFEQNSMFHIVPTDGRPFTKDLPPSWFGESVGRWDGDTLVVETVNLNGYTRVDTIGHPMSARARITQTFRRVDFDTIEHTFTLTDPKTYTSPWTVKDTWALDSGTRLLEYACMENNRACLKAASSRSCHQTTWTDPSGDITRGHRQFVDLRRRETTASVVSGTLPMGASADTRTTSTIAPRPSRIGISSSSLSPTVISLSKSGMSRLARMSERPGTRPTMRYRPCASVVTERTSPVSTRRMVTVIPDSGCCCSLVAVPKTVARVDCEATGCKSAPPAISASRTQTRRRVMVDEGA
jgi:hypothetical protein